MKPIYAMTDDELRELSNGDDDLAADAAFEELEKRDQCNRDSRVAQAMGNARGEQPS